MRHPLPDAAVGVAGDNAEQALQLLAELRRLQRILDEKEKAQAKRDALAAAAGGL